MRENNQAAGKTWVYTYDKGGNITSRKKYAYTTGTLGACLSTVGYTYGDSQWGDLLTGYNGQTVTSDAIGNMLSDGSRTFTWEHGRQLKSLTYGSITWDFTYAANGLRTGRTGGSTSYGYVYNGSRLSRMTVGGNILDFTYANGSPVSVTYNGTTYYYVTNLQGDITAILNTSGAVVAEYLYDAWGNLLALSGSMASTLGEINPLRYRGYVYDTESGLYYLQSRYYNPDLCRFINADSYESTGQGIVGYNMFAYCNNTPVSYADRGETRRERVDEFQDDWEPIGAGFQLDFSASLGELSGSLGVEIVIYWDTPEAKEKGEPVVAVYAYGGGSFDFSLFAEDITTLTNLLIGSADLIKSDGTTALEAALSTSNHSLSSAISLSGFLVFGNDKFENASHYTEGFETFSAGYCKARVSSGFI